MGLFFLFVILFILSLLFVMLCNGDVMEPLALSCESFALCTFIAFCYNGFHISDISVTTILIVISAILIYMVGYILMKSFLQKNGVMKYTKKERPFCIPSKMFTFFCLVFECFIFIIVFRSTLSIARMINAGTNILNMLQYARSAYLFTDAGMGIGVSVASLFVVALGYFYTYVIIYCIIRQQQTIKFALQSHKLELLIIIVSLFSSMMGSGRTFLIKYIIFLFISFYYTKFKKNRIKHVTFYNILKTVVKLLVIIVVFFVLFQIMGVFTNKTGKISAIDMFYGYSGAAVVALDRSIENYSYDGRFFGEESFYGLYGFLNALGCDIPNDILHLPFTDLEDGNSTNIYTSLRTYLYDFGYGGLFIVQFLLGMISAAMYALLYRFQMHPIYLIVYGILVYGTAMQGIEEITLRNFMSITNVFLVIFFVMLYIVTQQRKVKILWRKK